MNIALWNTLAFIVTLSVLVAVHEFGHFWVARRLGVHVLTFSIGFGPALWKRRDKRGCEYMIAAIPLGGYVKMLDEREGDVPAELVDRAFNRQSVRTRWAIVAAGPIFNFLLAFVFFSIMYLIGANDIRAKLGPVTENSVAAQAGMKESMEVIAVDGETALTWDDFINELVSHIGTDEPVLITLKDGDKTVDVTLPSSALQQVNDPPKFLSNLGISFTRMPAIVGSVAPDGAAHKAGLKVGDKIQQIDGQAIEQWGQVVEKIAANPSKTVRLEVQRAAQKLTINLVPDTVPLPDGGTKGYAGVGNQNAHLWIRVQYDPVSAAYHGMLACIKAIKNTVRNIWQLISGAISIKAIGGPLSIADSAGTTASISFDVFLKFLGVISVNLGLINLLPIPMLDGGHLLFYSIEAVRGKPLSERVQEFGMRIGLSLVATLMMVALYNDFTRYF